MATLTLEDGIFTVGLPTAAAFLMRTSMSAMGSVMLMEVPYEYTDIRFRENLFWIVPGTAGGPSGYPLTRASRRLYTTCNAPWGVDVASTGTGLAPVAPCPARGGGRGVAYQLALRRPGTSPRMVAWRSMLRPRPNFA